MERFDAIVVGAGPAGSTSAYRLADAGRRVLLLDKARFPRDKPCGGGLTVRALRQLPVSPDPVVEHVVDRFQVTFDYVDGLTGCGDGPLVHMTQRRRLDAFLVEAAVAAGATFRDGVGVKAFELTDDGVRVRVDGRPVRASVLVGADGANGTTASALGLAGGFTYGVALEGNLVDDRAVARFAGLAALELGAVPGGYGWVFPKGDHVNLGVGGWGGEGPKLRKHLADLCRHHGIDPDDLTGVRGHRLPMRRVSSRLVRGRALLVGDAAGLVDPLSGDGMFEAFVSSRLAAATVADLLDGRVAALDGYSSSLHRALDPLAVAAWCGKRIVTRFPRAPFRRPWRQLTWRTMFAFVRGEVLHADEPALPARLLLQVGASLAGDQWRGPALSDG